jgi:hypothetical protein
MYRLVRAGVHAACLEAALVAAVALTAIWQGEIGQIPIDPDRRVMDAPTLGYWNALALSDVLLAICVSMLRTPSVAESALHLRQGFRRLSPRHPRRAAASLIAQLLFASVGFAALALRPPPDWFLSSTAILVGTRSGLLLWPAIMSVGTAAFGSNAHAALLANPGWGSRRP